MPCASEHKVCSGTVDRVWQCTISTLVLGESVFEINTDPLQTTFFLGPAGDPSAPGDFQLKGYNKSSTKTC